MFGALSHLPQGENVPFTCITWPTFASADFVLAAQRGNLAEKMKEQREVADSR